ncbi:Phosphoribosyltransferase (plasmid) [Cupriavidus necator]
MTRKTHEGEAILPGMQNRKMQSRAAQRQAGRLRTEHRTFRYHVPMVRRFGFPPGVTVISAFADDTELKADPDYERAKSGDKEAATGVVTRLGMALLEQAGVLVPQGCLFVAPHAREALGDNAIPQIFAAAMGLFGGGRVDYEIVQVTKVYHTGADPMERLNARPRFSGKVELGSRYVLIDDVTTMGGTLAELAHFIQARGGIVQGVVVLVNASRAGVLQPQKRVVKLLTERFGHEITEICGIEPGALTADEANYLIGFRSADEIRYRKAAAAKETTRRLRSKGILGLGQPERLAAFDASFAAHFRRALWRAHRQKLFRS